MYQCILITNLFNDLFQRFEVFALHRTPEFAHYFLVECDLVVGGFVYETTVQLPRIETDLRAVDRLKENQSITQYDDQRTLLPQSPISLLP